MMADKPMMDRPMPPEDESAVEMPSVFLSKEALAGKTYKPGDTITMTVKDVDPESGEVEAVCSGSGDSGESKGYSSDFDQSMPEDEMEEA